MDTPARKQRKQLKILRLFCYTETSNTSFKAVGYFNLLVNFFLKRVLTKKCRHFSSTMNMNEAYYHKL